MISAIKGQRVLFITTKNIDYIRNSQEMGLIAESASSYHVIGSGAKSYPKRLLHVYKEILCTKCNEYDVIFIGFAPQLVLPLFKKRFGREMIIIDFFISMYDTLCMDRQRIKASGLLGRLLHRIDEGTLASADLVITDTKAHKDFFIDEFHGDKEKFVTLYLEADTSIYKKKNVPRPSGLADKFIVLYFGSVLPLQGVDVVLEAYDLLKNVENIHFYFIGPLKNLQNKPTSDNIEYIDWLSQEELCDYINMSDLCIAGHFHPTIQKARRTIPGKAYIYHALEKPMILGDNPANHELFDKDCLVSFVEMGNAHALANEIMNWKRRISQD